MRVVLSCNTLCSNSFLSESVEDAGDAEVGGGAAPDGADGGHRRHDLDRLWAVWNVPVCWDEKLYCIFKKCPHDLNLIILGYVFPCDSVPLGHSVGPECAGDEGDPPTELAERLRLESDFLRGNEMIKLSFPLNSESMRVISISSIS